MKKKLENFVSPSHFIPKSKTSPFNTFLKSKGNDFENNLVNYIHNNIYPIETISDKIDESTCLLALEKIKNGVPFLYSIPFNNEKLKIRGIIDFLIRSDYLYLLTGEKNYENIKPFYIAIDIKFSTIPLKSDGIHICNIDRFPFYKKQLYLYTLAIGDIQGY